MHSVGNWTGLNLLLRMHILKNDLLKLRTQNRVEGTPSFFFFKSCILYYCIYMRSVDLKSVQLKPV